jgi:hypothetical protein
MANSQGDPRVLFVMNLVLSALFASVVVWGLDYVGILSLSLARIAIAAGVLMVITHLVTR